MNIAPSNEESGESSGDSYTVFSIFEMTNHETEEDNDEGEIIRESISERELSREDWVLVNYDNVKKSEKWKWPKKEENNL